MLLEFNLMLIAVFPGVRAKGTFASWTPAPMQGAAAAHGPSGTTQPEWSSCGKISSCRADLR